MTAVAEPKAPIPASPPGNAAREEYRLVPIGEVHESPWNPRQTYNQATLEELAASMRRGEEEAPGSGQVAPCIVRPRKGGGWELAAGHRRLRAAKLAGLTTLKVVARPMDDSRFLEILLLENNQREGVHELEEARGYQRLIKLAHYDVPRIAAGIGRSTKYVYDRIKLLDLIPELQEIFLKKVIDAGHAILLARLTPAEQKRVNQDALFDSQGEPDVDGDGRQLSFAEAKQLPKESPVSVRQLAEWINTHIRLDEARVADPILFPETTQQLQLATEKRTKVVHIRYDTFLSQMAQDPKDHCFGPTAWKRADGKEWTPHGYGYSQKKQLSKTCPHAVLGLVIAGESRGEAFLVCVKRKLCAIHWPEEVKREQRRREGKAKENEKAAKQVTAGATPAKAAKPAAPPPTPFEETPEGRKAILGVLAEEAEAIAELVQAIAKKELAGIGDRLAWNLWQRIQDAGGMGWAEEGKWPGYSQNETAFEDLRDMVLDELDLKDREKTGKQARLLIAYDVYNSRDFDASKFDRSVVQRAQERVKKEAKKVPAPKAAAATKKPAAKTPVKKPAKKHGKKK